MDGNTQFQTTAKELQERLAPQIDQARKNFNDFNLRAVSFIRQNPGTCILGAVAIGYLVGKLASRR